MNGSSLIVLGHAKGGVGKSTLAVHIAVGLYDMGQRVAVIDADEDNRTSGYWLPAVEENIPLYAASTPEEIEQAIRHASAEHDFIIADSAGGLLSRSRTQGRTLLCYSDFFIIPVEPSLKAVRPLPDVQSLVEEVARERGYALDARILINGVDGRKRASKEIAEAVRAATTLPIFNTVLPSCTQFDTAEEHDTVITRMNGADRRAKNSIHMLLAELMGELVVSINNRPPPSFPDEVAEEQEHSNEKEIVNG